MRILFLTPQLPYPAISGGLIKTLKMIEFLSSHYEVEVGFFQKDLTEKGKSDLREFQKRYPVETFFEEMNIERSGVNFLKSLVQRVPLSIYRNLSATFMHECQKRAQSCDLIFIDHFLMFQYLPNEWRKKVILHEHNAEYLMWERYGETQTNPIKKILLQFEADRIKNYEKSIIERADIVLASNNDIDILSKITTKKVDFIETLHLGDEYLLEREQLLFDKTEYSMLYIGTLTWEANREGLLWFLQNVWPIVKTNHPQLKFDIVGKNNDPSLFAEWLNDPQIRWHGFVDSLDTFYDKARLSVAPLNFGSGIKVKVINAIYRGLPMVTTTIGVEGLKLSNAHDIFISDDAKNQAEQISTLLMNKKEWEKISVNSREIANRLYSWDRVLQSINKAILK